MFSYHVTKNCYGLYLVFEMVGVQKCLLCALPWTKLWFCKWKVFISIIEECFEENQKVFWKVWHILSLLIHVYEMTFATLWKLIFHIGFSNTWKQQKYVWRRLSLIKNVRSHSDWILNSHLHTSVTKDSLQ